MTTLLEICNQITAWLSDDKPQAPTWSSNAWESFKSVCLVHGVGPLMYGRLKSACWLEESIKTWLLTQYTLNQQRIMTMHAELAEILVAFNQHSIDVMPLKGSILSTTLYTDSALRPMADLDLLIHLVDYEAAASILRELGYEQDTVHWKHTEFIKPDNRVVVSTTSEHPDNPRSIELHLYCRETFGGPTLDMSARIWQNTKRDILLGIETIFPAQSELWLYLLVHASYHIWQGKGRLIHLYDIKLLTPQIDDIVAVLATVDARYTYLALRLCQACFPDNIDSSILAAQSEQVSKKFRAWVDGFDLVNTSCIDVNSPGLYFFRAYKFADGHPREILQALRFSFLPNLTELALDHPTVVKSKVPWLAYLFLPLDWTKRLLGQAEK